MDAVSILEQYTSDLANLPAEVAHVLEEIREKDVEAYDLRKKINQRDNSIQKFIKQHGSLAENPKEAPVYPKIREDYKKLLVVQEAKCQLATKGLFLVTRHYKRLGNDIKKLEDEGLLPPSNTTSAQAVADMTARSTSANSMHSSRRSMSRNISPPSSRGSTPGYVPAGRPQKRARVSDSPGEITSGPTPSSGPRYRPTSEEEEVLYCTCQQVSFGNMVACDNPDCQYEWFHYDCVGLKEPPSGTWYCSACIKDMREKKRSRN